MAYRATMFCNPTAESRRLLWWNRSCTNDFHPGTSPRAGALSSTPSALSTRQSFAAPAPTLSLSLYLPTFIWASILCRSVMPAASGMRVMWFQLPMSVYTISRHRNRNNRFMTLPRLPELNPTNIRLHFIKGASSDLYDRVAAVYKAYPAGRSSTQLGVNTEYR